LSRRQTETVGAACVAVQTAEVARLEMGPAGQALKFRLALTPPLPPPLAARPEGEGDKGG